MSLLHLRRVDVLFEEDFGLPRTYVDTGDVSVTLSPSLGLSPLSPVIASWSNW